MDIAIDYLFDTINALYQNPYDRLVNTDGDPMIYSKTHFKLEISPEEAAQKFVQ